MQEESFVTNKTKLHFHNTIFIIPKKIKGENMHNEQYLTSSETLYYLDRLDRYTPLTAKYIRTGTAIITPLTQDELIPVILGEIEMTGETINRELHKAGCSCGGKTYDDIKDHDNNHSIHWDNGYVHAVGREITFWNLDDDLRNVLDEAFSIDEKIGAKLLYAYVFDIMKDDKKFIGALSQYGDLDFMQWLDERRGELPPAPDMDNYDQDIAQTYYDALNDIILAPLSKMTQYNDDIKELIIRVISKNDQIADNLKRNVMRCFVNDVFPLNDKAEGYIINGYKTMVPNDARRGAVYVGNIVDVLKNYKAGTDLIRDDEIEKASSLGKGAKENLYPTAMQRGMPSDWLTECPYKDLRFEPKQEYPRLSYLNLCFIEYDFELEKDAVFDEPELEELSKIIAILKDKEKEWHALQESNLQPPA